MAIIKNRYAEHAAEAIKIAEYVVNFKDVFILKSAYERMREWFVEEGYATNSDKDFPEVFYLDKEGKGGKELWIRWRFQKNPMGGKMKDFWRYDFDVDIHVLTLVQVETIVDNKKIKADKGEVEIQVKANLVMDWKSMLKKNSLLSPFKEIIYRFFLHDTRKRLENEFYENVYGFRETLANFFKLLHYEAKKGGIEFWPRKLPE
ncbi:hypothetical protein GF358_00425 [Candidatus Woesearchaeota archaeon]|nr:hypothetical protein [Candidatus Woesearchaeota archaeon]